MEFCVGLSRYWPWPQELKEKAFLDYFFHCCFRLFGKRIADEQWYNDYVKEDTIDFSNGGVFRKEARDPKKPKKCTHIVHILFPKDDEKTHEIDEDIHFAMTQPVTNNHSDLKAKSKHHEKNWIDEFGSKLDNLKTSISPTGYKTLTESFRPMYDQGQAMSEAYVAHLRAPERLSRGGKSRRVQAPPSTAPQMWAIMGTNSIATAAAPMLTDVTRPAASNMLQDENQA